MAKHLSQLTNSIKGYLHRADNTVLHKQKRSLSNKNANLAPALKLAIIRGESHVNMACFDFFAHKNFTEDFIYHAYEKIYHDSNAIMDFVQHCGLVKDTESYITQGLTNQADSYQHLCQQLYYLLVDHLYQHEEMTLYNHATFGFIRHYFPSFYPKQAEVKPSLKIIKKQLQTLLNKQFHTKVTIKESFVTTDDRVNFRLILWISGYHPFELVEIEAKRLRSARFQAYHRTLERLQLGQLLVQPIAKMAKKKQGIRAL